MSPTQSNSVDTGLPVSVPGKADAWLDFIQMCTGLALILFMWCHMILVSSVIIGPGVMNALARFFEATYMAQLGGPLIGLVFLLHFVLAARKVPFRLEQQQTILRHARMLHHGDTWLWVFQAVSGMAILIIGAAHMWVVLSGLPINAFVSAARIQHWPWLVFYIFLLFLVEIHLGVGLYRIGVKWGVIKRANRKQAKRWELILTLCFLTIGVATLIRFVFLDLL